MNVFSRFFYYYPFTFSGTALFLFSVYLLGAGYGQRNYITLFLSVIALGFLTVLYILGRIQVFRFRDKNLTWKVPPYIYAGSESRDLLLYGDSGKTFLFYRIHISLIIRQKIDNRAFFRLYKEEIFTGEGEAVFPLSMTVCGQAELKGQCRIGDIFGLTRNRFGKTVLHKLGVLPSMLRDKGRKISIEGGSETKSRQKDSDEEKYYMRDYIPGDRLRDINWKASSRSSDLFTRISPVSQEKSRTLFIDFRHYSGTGPADQDTGSSKTRIYHLDYIKRWLFTFLWRTKRADPSFRFDIITGKGRTVLQEEDDLIKLAYQMGGLFYQKDPGFFHQPGETEEIYIFTTPYDLSFPRVLTEYAGLSLHLFRTSFPGAGGEQEDIRILQAGHPMLPGPWFFTREKKKGGRFPGISAGPGITIEEQQIRVRGV